MSELHRQMEKFQDHIQSRAKMKQVDVLVIGGSAAGIVAATTSRNFYPDKTVALVRKEKNAGSMRDSLHVWYT